VTADRDATRNEYGPDPAGTYEELWRPRWWADRHVRWDDQQVQWMDHDEIEERAA